MLNEVLCNKVVDFVVKNTEEIDDIKIETIRYGIKVFMINVYKIPIIFITAYMLGIFKYAVISYICFGALRAFAGGIHADRGIGCIASSMTVLYSPVYLSNYLNRSHNIILFTITFIIIILYAPSDTRKKPIKSKKLRSDLKAKSILTAITIFISSMFMPEKMSVVMAAGIFMESLLVLPITYKIFRKERSSHA